MSDIKYSYGEYMSEFIKFLKVSREEENHVNDLKFICKDNVGVYANKLMLISVSPFLRGIIKSVPCETENIHISLPDVDSKILRIFVNFLYEGISKLNQREMMLLHDIFKLFAINLQNSEITATRASNEDRHLVSETNSEKMVYLVSEHDKHNLQQESYSNLGHESVHIREIKSVSSSENFALSVSTPTVQHNLSFDAQVTEKYEVSKFTGVQNSEIIYKTDETSLQLTGHSNVQGMISQYVVPVPAITNFYTFPQPMQYYSLYYIPQSVEYMNGNTNVDSLRSGIQNIIISDSHPQCTTTSGVTHENTKTLAPMSVLESNTNVGEAKLGPSFEFSTGTNSTLIHSENVTSTLTENNFRSNNVHDETSSASFSTDESENEEEINNLSYVSSKATCCMSTVEVFKPILENCLPAETQVYGNNIEFETISECVNSLDISKYDINAQKSASSSYEMTRQLHTSTPINALLDNIIDSTEVEESFTNIQRVHKDDRELPNNFDVKISSEEKQADSSVVSRNTCFSGSGSDKDVLATAISNFDKVKQSISSSSFQNYIVDDKSPSVLEEDTADGDEDYDDIKFPFELVETYLEEPQTSTQLINTSSYFLDNHNYMDPSDPISVENRADHENLTSNPVILTNRKSGRLFDECLAMFENDDVESEGNEMMKLSESQIKTETATVNIDTTDPQTCVKSSGRTYSVRKKITIKQVQKNQTLKLQHNLTGIGKGQKGVKLATKVQTKRVVRKKKKKQSKSKNVHVVFKKPEKFLKRVTRSSRITRSHRALPNSNNENDASYTSVLSGQPSSAHLNKSRNCKTCGKCFISVKALKSHMVIHNEIKSSDIKTENDCSDKSNSLQDGNLQMVKKNTKATNKNKSGTHFPCNKCEVTCHSRASFDKHLHLHERKRPFSCQVCVKKFIRQADLYSHMFVHTNARPYLCQLCGSSFKMKKHLKTHIWLVHLHKKY